MPEYEAVLELKSISVDEFTALLDAAINSKNITIQGQAFEGTQDFMVEEYYDFADLMINRVDLTPLQEAAFTAEVRENITQAFEGQSIDFKRYNQFLDSDYKITHEDLAFPIKDLESGIREAVQIVQNNRDDQAVHSKLSMGETGTVVRVAPGMPPPSPD
mgnify:CR=1 FL=1